MSQVTALVACRDCDWRSAGGRHQGWHTAIQHARLHLGHTVDIRDETELSGDSILLTLATVSSRTLAGRPTRHAESPVR